MIPFSKSFDPFREVHKPLTQASSPFSMSKRKGPFCPPSLSTQRLQNVALLWRSSTLRVWLPSQRLPRSFRPRIPLSGLNTPGLFPSEPSSLPVIRMRVSSHRSAPALPVKTLKPSPGAPTASSHRESRISCSPVFQPRRDPCSPGPYVLLGSPFAEPRKKHLPSYDSLAPFADELVAHLTDRSPRDCSLSDLASPLVRGADPSGLSHRPPCPAL